MNTNIELYYAQRAKEYEKVYQKPERQSDIQVLKEYLQTTFRTESVYEIACGTGFWTQDIAKTAKEIYATDLNEEVLEIAKTKDYASKVSFQQANMYESTPPKSYSAIFGGFIWSHVPLQKLEAWLEHFHKVVMPIAKCVFIDNQFVEGSNTPIHHKDEMGNTYQKRKLSDGSEHMVLKNFPSDKDFYRILASKSTNLQIRRLNYFWILEYQTLKA